MTDEIKVDTQAEAPQNIEIVDEGTLSQAIESYGNPAAEAEAPEKTEEIQQGTQSEGKKTGKKFLDRFDSEEKANESYKELQTAYQKAVGDLKELRSKMENKTKEEIKALDYDSQLNYILDEMSRIKQEKAQMEEAQRLQQAQMILAEDAKAIDAFTQNNEILSNYPSVSEKFKFIAQNLRDEEGNLYTIESVYEHIFKPMAEELMGRKIKVKERPITGSSRASSDFSLKAIEDMTPQEYEKFRQTGGLQKLLSNS